jgi:hypothetical protein
MFLRHFDSQVRCTTGSWVDNLHHVSTLSSAVVWHKITIKKSDTVVVRSDSLYVH